MSKQAWVTLATNDSYALGALVLAHSLRRVNSAFPAVVLITPSVSENMRTRLSAVFAEVVTVDVLDSGDAAHLALLARPELGITFTKIHCWMLTQYDKCVFLDADTLVVQNSDELFEREELSAAPDVGWPDCFNSGVFVFRPSETTFDNILQFAKERGSFDGGDQGLLNSFFPTWAQGDMTKRLPFVYNVTSVAFYSYLPALKQFGDGLKIIHFIGNAKPWLQQFNWESRTVGGDAHLQPSLQLWWDIFVDNVHSQLDEAMTGLAGTLARLSVGPVSGQRAALDEHTRRQGWEAGNIDYMGADAFDNIWAKISATLAGDQSAPALAPQESSSVPPQEPTPVPPQEPTPAQGSAPVPPSAEESVGAGAPERATRKPAPADKLNCQLKPSVETLLPTPDSEYEDAATLAQKIIASELGMPSTPQVISATPPVLTTTPSIPKDEKQLSVEELEVTTPPVSLAQIGVLPKKGEVDISKSEDAPESLTELKQPIETNKSVRESKTTDDVKLIEKEIELPVDTSKAMEATEPKVSDEPVKVPGKSDKTESEVIEAVKASECIPSKTAEASKPEQALQTATDTKVLPLPDTPKDATKLAEAKSSVTSTPAKTSTSAPEKAATPAKETADEELKKITEESKPEASEQRKKKMVKKVVKKQDSGDKAGSSEPPSPAPVPPPRKKEKKPTEKK